MRLASLAIIAAAAVGCGSERPQCRIVGEHDWWAIRQAIQGIGCADLPQSIAVHLSIRRNSFGAPEWTITENGVSHPSGWVAVPFDSSANICWESSGWTDNSVSPSVAHDYVLQLEHSSLGLSRLSTCSAMYSLLPR